MKIPNPIHNTRHALQHIALAAALAAGSVQAQTHHVAGAGVIGDEVLTTVAGVATVPRGGSYWSAAGGEGVVYSRLYSPTLIVPTTGPVTLKFNHRYYFEDGWDGGAVYVTVNGAGPTYLPAAAFSANGYVSDLSANGSSVFKGGEQVFTGQSSGWPSSTRDQSIANLGTLNAGDTISIQFKGGWDEGYNEAAPNWEISAVEVRDAANTAMLNVDFLNGPGGFTADSDAGLAGPWAYIGPKSEFEINADTLTADRYVADVPGSVIDINHTNLSVVLLAGTLVPGNTFTLFDLTGGTTLTGTYDNISLPAGRWDMSKLAVNGSIAYTAESNILSFTFPTSGAATINQASKTIIKYMPEGTNLTSLAADFTLSDGATCKVAGNPVTSGAAFNFTNPVAYVVTASDNSNSSTYTVKVNLVPVESTVTWNVGGGGTWDTSTLNWLGQISGLPTAFIQGNNVIFNKDAGGAIAITSDMAPASTTVAAANGNYIFSGGPLAGSGSLTKSGDGTLTLAGTNTYTGKTILKAGTLATALGADYMSNAGSPGVYGAPTGANATIDLYNGVILQNNGSNPRLNQSTDRPLNLADTDSGTVTIRFNDNDTSLSFGAVTATGTGAKKLALFTGCNGNGDREAIIFTGAIADSSDASPTSLEVNFRTQTGSTSYVSLSGTNTFTGPITLVQGSGPPTGYLVIGGVRAPQSGTLTVGTGTLGNGNYAGALNLATGSILEYASTAAQTLSGVISGPGSVRMAATGGVLTLTGTNTYAGTTTVNAGTLLVNGTNSGSGAVSVSSGATLGGTGTLGGTTTIAGGGKLAFTLSTTAANHDRLDITGALVFSGASTLNITASGTLPAAGVYTLITATGGITGSVPTVNLPAGWAATVSISGDTQSLLLNVTSNGTTAYGNWALAHAGGVNAPVDGDYNHDGVQNGIAFFMGMNGLATNPGVVNRSITWPYRNSVASYKVQTSLDLSPSGWTDVPSNDPNLHTTAAGTSGSVTYDLPTGVSGGKVFARLVVTP